MNYRTRLLSIPAIPRSGENVAMQHLVRMARALMRDGTTVPTWVGWRSRWRETVNALIASATLDIFRAGRDHEWDRADDNVGVCNRLPEAPRIQDSRRSIPVDQSVALHS